MEQRLRRALEALGITPSEEQIQAAKRTLTLREERNYIEMYLSGEIDGPKKIESEYRKVAVPLPPQFEQAPGIDLFGHTVKSLVFSTDPYIIRNCNADAVFAVAPFTCQPAISQALINVSERPVVVGVAGTLTSGIRAIELAVEVEMQGASGVMVNMTSSAELIHRMAYSIDIPVILTADRIDSDLVDKIAAGARIINVAAAKDTPKIVRELRKMLPGLPIIASAGPTDESMQETIEAGADAVTWTPPTIQELERITMQHNRER